MPALGLVGAALLRLLLQQGTLSFSMVSAARGHPLVPFLPKDTRVETPHVPCTYPAACGIPVSEGDQALGPVPRCQLPRWRQEAHGAVTEQRPAVPAAHQDCAGTGTRARTAADPVGCPRVAKEEGSGGAGTFR